MNLILRFILSIIITQIMIATLEYKLIMKKSNKISELEYIKKKYKRKISKKNLKRNSIIISLTNGFIIGLTSSLIYYLKVPLIIAFPLSFILMLILIIVLYDYILNRIIK